MTYEELVAKSPSNSPVTLEHEGAQSSAILFRREAVHPQWEEEEFEVWLETAEDEEDDDDLELCGLHPVGEGTQVERLFWRRPSEGANGKVYVVDVDGTVVPGTLDVFAESFDIFSPSE